MDIKDIERLAKEIAEMANIPIECPKKPNCNFEEKGICCREFGYFKIQRLLTKGVLEGIRKDALLLPENATDKSKYNVQLQHDGHNQLDTMRELLYRIDKEKLETGDLRTTSIYVAAEYIRTHVEKMRFILNELYLNNKT